MIESIKIDGVKLSLTRKGIEVDLGKVTPEVGAFLSQQRDYELASAQLALELPHWEKPRMICGGHHRYRCYEIRKDTLRVFDPNGVKRPPYAHNNYFKQTVWIVTKLDPNGVPTGSFIHVNTTLRAAVEWIQKKRRRDVAPVLEDFMPKKEAPSLREKLEASIEKNQVLVKELLNSMYPVDLHERIDMTHARNAKILNQTREIEKFIESLQRLLND